MIKNVLLITMSLISPLLALNLPIRVSPSLSPLTIMAFLVKIMLIT